MENSLLDIATITDKYADTLVWFSRLGLSNFPQLAQIENDVKEHIIKLTSCSPEFYANCISNPVKKEYTMQEAVILDLYWQTVEKIRMAHQSTSKQNHP